MELEYSPQNLFLSFSRTNAVGRIMPDKRSETKTNLEESREPIIRPVCGEVTVQEKCKVVCRSEKCRGWMIMLNFERHVAQKTDDTGIELPGGPAACEL